jgi:protein phosphatase
VRGNNQDQFLIAQPTRSISVTSTSLSMERRLFGKGPGELLLVADGMGGHAAGEHASQLAISHLVRRLLTSVLWHLPDGGESSDREDAYVRELEVFLKDAHARILQESAQNAEYRGMGTTLTMAHILWPRMYVLHAGDSRCYLIRDGRAEQLTTDHTLARQMVESGGLRPEDEAYSKWSNVLWNVLGGNAGTELIAEVRRFELQRGDAIVLCSDGLHRYVDRERLAAIVLDADSPQAACRALISLANESGGEDNITVIVSRPGLDDQRTTTLIEDFETVFPSSLDTITSDQIR